VKNTVKLHVLKMREIEDLMLSCPEQNISQCEYCTELLQMFKVLSGKFLHPTDTVPYVRDSTNDYSDGSMVKDDNFPRNMGTV